MGCVLAALVVPNLQGLLDARKALGQLGQVRLEKSLLSTEAVHFGLALGERCCDLFLQDLRCAGHLVDLGSELLNLTSRVVLLRVGNSLSEELLGGIGLGLGLHLCDHVSDEALDLGEYVLLVAATEADCGRHPACQLRRCGGVLLLAQVSW